MTRAGQSKPKAGRTAPRSRAGKAASGINRIVVTDGKINARAKPPATVAAGSAARPRATSATSHGINRIVVTDGKIKARAKLRARG